MYVKKSVVNNQNFAIETSNYNSNRSKTPPKLPKEYRNPELNVEGVNSIQKLPELNERIENGPELSGDLTG